MAGSSNTHADPIFEGFRDGRGHAFFWHRALGHLSHRHAGRASERAVTQEHSLPCNNASWCQQIGTSSVEQNQRQGCHNTSAAAEAWLLEVLVDKRFYKCDENAAWAYILCRISTPKMASMPRIHRLCPATSLDMRLEGPGKNRTCNLHLRTSRTTLKLYKAAKPRTHPNMEITLKVELATATSQSAHMRRP